MKAFKAIRNQKSTLMWALCAAIGVLSMGTGCDERELIKGESASFTLIEPRFHDAGRSGLGIFATEEGK